ncbi:intradiol ring-cleavage dioxygenase [Sphingopyxis sp. MG]|uniref:intradiol ring-cleavage dioxygenase n=1 Tax=Sphingopyxis sp. MG TaxID=1866325 RepID=UPI000CDF4101|nr:intradiol ring-cleavage dioxygenase [Sphingopyxis sp. MG]AVA15074.1 hydroxyquinol 1,2-dioxygenase [Sphingopyxis sp. MG]
MRDFDEQTITQAVLTSFENTPDPRLRQILTSLTRHIHDFVRDIEPSFAEWRDCVDFLTRTGQICDEKRQEFILLSDTLGISMLVDAINHRMPEGTTETTVLGPFFVVGAPALPLGADISDGMSGEPLYVEGKVVSASGIPLAGATIDVWQSDGEGFYDVQMPERDNMALRAQFSADADGRFHFWSVRPSFYPIPYDGTVGDMLKATSRHPNRPAHIHFMIRHDGYEPLVTHLFDAESLYLDNDTVFGVKDSLIVPFEHKSSGTAPDGKAMDGSWHALNYAFGLKPAAGSVAASVASALAPAAA